MTLTAVEAEVLVNVTEDFCTLQEIEDRLAFMGVARPPHSTTAVLVLERNGLIEKWSGGPVPLYRPTSAGTIALLAHRRRARIVHTTLATGTPA